MSKTKIHTNMNINDNVQVTLTPTGMMILLRYYEELTTLCPDSKMLDGEFQMWELFEIFGPHINQAMQASVFASNRIRVSVEIDHEVMPAHSDIVSTVCQIISDECDGAPELYRNAAKRIANRYVSGFEAPERNTAPYQSPESYNPLKPWHRITVEPAFGSSINFDKAVEHAKELGRTYDCLVNLPWNGVTVCIDDRRTTSEHWQLYVKLLKGSGFDRATE